VSNAVLLLGPFTPLTHMFLNVSSISDGFGPEDKLQLCNSDLVFVDLNADDAYGAWYA
jgi:hypothetical protein